MIIRVADSGPGIPVEDRARVFEPFAEAGHVRTEAGLGIDLFIARTRAEGLGATLSLADTTPGARFERRVPKHR